MTGWQVQLPDDSRAYLVRTVYRVSWAVYSPSGQIGGWKHDRVAEDIQSSTFWVGTSPVPGQGFCLIH